MDNPPSHKNSVNSSCSPLIQLQVRTWNLLLEISIKKTTASKYVNWLMKIVIQQIDILIIINDIELAIRAEMFEIRVIVCLFISHTTSALWSITPSENHALALGIKLPAAGANSTTFFIQNDVIRMWKHVRSPLFTYYFASESKERPSKH